MAASVVFSCLFILSYFLIFGLCDPFPKEIERCRTEDHKCICKVANSVVRTYGKGNKALGIPKFDPYFLNKTIELTPHGTSGGVNLNLKVRNMNIIGLSTQDFQTAVGFGKDPYTSKYELYGHVPKLIFEGEYEATGQLLFAPINGKGNFDFVCEDIKGALKFKPNVRKMDGKHYLHINRLKALLEPNKVKITLENLFNGNKEIGEAINNLINENIKIVWDELSPSAYGAAEIVMKDVIDKIISKYAYEDMFLDL